MSTTTITLDGSPVTLVPFITCPKPKMVEPWVMDSVAMVTSVFTGQSQAQGASGADIHGVKLTYAPLRLSQAGPLRAWLMQMRGMARATQLTPPDYGGPQGRPLGVPLVNGAHVAAATQLSTKGWVPSRHGHLLPGDLIQIGYRLHTVLDIVSSDADGHASFEIFPSLRADLPDGAAIVAANPLGLYRLAGNKRNWSVRLPNITDLTISLVEYR